MPASGGIRREQFEDGQSTGQGTGNVDLASVQASPSPAYAGDPVEFLVTLSGPAPADTSVQLLIDGVDLGVPIEIAAGAQSGNVVLGIPVTQGPVTVTARLGTREVRTVLRATPASS